MNRALKYTLVTLLVLFALVVAILQGLYFKGARDISPQWRPTTTTYPDSARLALWRWYGGEGQPQANPMSPLEYAWRWYRASRDLLEGRPGDAGMTMAYRAARHAEMARTGGGMGGYHLMQAAASIQASRWTAESQLDTQLDQLWFGDGAQGMRAGSARIFGKPVEMLDDAQLWVLLVVGQSQMHFDPWCQRDRVRMRMRGLASPTQRNIHLTRAEIDAALDSAVPAPSGHPCGS